jgi:hypothetical protein
MKRDRSESTPDHILFYAAGSRATLATSRVSRDWNGRFPNHQEHLYLVDKRWLLMVADIDDILPTGVEIGPERAIEWLEDNSYAIPDELADLHNRREFSFADGADHESAGAVTPPPSAEQMIAECENRGEPHEVVRAFDTRNDNKLVPVNLANATRLYDYTKWSPERYSPETGYTNTETKKRIFRTVANEYLLREVHRDRHQPAWGDPVYKILSLDKAGLELTDTGIDLPDLPLYCRVTTGCPDGPPQRVVHVDKKRMWSIPSRAKEGEHVECVLYATYEGKWLIGEKRWAEGERSPDEFFYVLVPAMSVARIFEELGHKLPPELQAHNQWTPTESPTSKPAASATLPVSPVDVAEPPCEKSASDSKSNVVLVSDVSSTAELMQTATHKTQASTAHKVYDQRHATNDEETRAAIREEAKETQRILSDILGEIRARQVAAASKSVQRPASPTRTYCLKSPNRIQWIGEIEVEQRLWHLLGAILDGRCQPLSFGMAGEAMSPGSMLAGKTIANCVAELNKALMGVEWPHTYRTKNRSILTDINFPPATA